MEEKETNRPQKDKNYTWHLDHPWLTFLGDEAIISDNSH